jgi:hypothetical protein
MRLERLSIAGLSKFYPAVLRAWQLLRPTREGGVEPEPIFHNPTILLRLVQPAILQKQLMAASLLRLSDRRLLGRGLENPGSPGTTNRTNIF